jgi:hypothetical protein
MMTGKRINREKLTIRKMIALYQQHCPQAVADDAHYQALNDFADKRLDKCVFGEENQPANNALCTVTSLLNVKR